MSMEYEQKVLYRTDHIKRRFPLFGQLGDLAKLLPPCPGHALDRGGCLVTGLCPVPHWGRKAPDPRQLLAVRPQVGLASKAL